ncbi:MAG: hypothetical protein WA139_03240 [Candidatus Aenigmatarchaeota archaeon]
MFIFIISPDILIDLLHGGETERIFTVLAALERRRNCTTETKKFRCFVPQNIHNKVLVLRAMNVMSDAMDDTTNMIFKNELEYISTVFFGLEKSEDGIPSTSDAYYISTIELARDFSDKANVEVFIVSSEHDKVTTAIKTISAELTQWMKAHKIGNLSFTSIDISETILKMQS